MDSDFIELHAIVRGLVQGVGFRYQTQQLATELHLQGTVRNRTDGSVEITAQGTREQVDALIAKLRNSSGPGRIDTVETTYRRPKTFIASFKITH